MVFVVGWNNGGYSINGQRQMSWVTLKHVTRITGFLKFAGHVRRILKMYGKELLDCRTKSWLHKVTLNALSLIIYNTGLALISETRLTHRRKLWTWKHKCRFMDDLQSGRNVLLTSCIISDSSNHTPQLTGVGRILYTVWLIHLVVSAPCKWAASVYQKIHMLHQPCYCLILVWSLPSRHGPDFHRPQSQITIDSPDFHLRRSQKCLLGY